MTKPDKKQMTQQRRVHELWKQNTSVGLECRLLLCLWFFFSVPVLILCFFLYLGVFGLAKFGRRFGLNLVRISPVTQITGQKNHLLSGRKAVKAKRLPRQRWTGELSVRTVQNHSRITEKKVAET